MDGMDGMDGDGDGGLIKPWPSKIKGRGLSHRAGHGRGNEARVRTTDPRWASYRAGRQEPVGPTPP